jgi:ADP-ribose pyrophosphatase YjhB (NUDIX family)
VLLGKRGSEPGKGKWALPSGYIEFEDDFLSAGIREVREETGLHVEIEAIVNVDSAFLSPQYHFLTVYLLAHVVGGELYPGDDLEKVGWYSKKSPLPELVFRQDLELIQCYTAGRLKGLTVEKVDMP